MVCLYTVLSYTTLRDTTAGGHQMNIPAASVDDAFAVRLTEFMQKMTSSVPPRRVPSGPECGFCELTKGDCSERVEAMSA